MTNPLDESAKAAAEWVETTPDTVLQACGLVNAYQLGWKDGQCPECRRLGIPGRMPARLKDNGERNG